MFSEKLKKTMKELNINQSQLSGLTGRSKGSISQYLSGKQIPPDETKEEIAIALGLKKEFFKDDKPNEKKDVFSGEEMRKHKVPKMLPEDVAICLGMHPETVRKGLQQGVFPWGYAIRTTENRWTYFVNAKRFAEIEGMNFGGRDVKKKDCSQI